MARARLLKPQLFSNESLSEVPPIGRLLFIGLWTLADKKGRLRDSPRWIKGQLFPFENVGMDKLLADLDERGFICRYAIDGEGYIQVTNFEKHQRPHANEPESSIPPLGEGLAPKDEVTSDNVASTSDIGDPSTTSTSSGISDPVLGNLEPVNIAVGAKSRRRPLSEIDESYLVGVQDEHLGIDVRREFAKFGNYLKAKNKTYTDYPAAFSNWLLKADEYASVQRHGPASNSVSGESKMAEFARRNGIATGG